MASKKELIAQQVTRAVGAGKPVAMETVDFSDPNRPKTCLEVDFPILPVNQVAIVEGNAGKPIYQMSKWWARRRSSVFRSMLIAAATKAPEDPSHAAKLVWDSYYANHQKKGAFKHLKVADIFMGGGTTLVEGARLGMKMFGNDLNPVAWFVVKQELADVDLEEIKRVLADIEAQVRPQIMPFYFCDGPNGEKGKWIHVPSGRVEGPSFDPLSLTPETRQDYRYEGPEIIYTFWAKHGVCQVTGCGHRTPIMTTPVLAMKTLTVKHWPHQCSKCACEFDIEDGDARMAPDVPLYVAPSEHPYSVIDARGRVTCPRCGFNSMVKVDKGKNKKVESTLLVHPQWLAGSPKFNPSGMLLGGSAQDDAASTTIWNEERLKTLRLLEVRGTLPETVTCPETAVTFHTGKEGGTVPKKSTFACGKCGRVQDVLESTAITGKTAPYFPIMFQGVSPLRKKQGAAYGGRFFAPYSNLNGVQLAEREWETRSIADLAEYWPKEELPYGLEADFWSVRRHGYTHWYTMFNKRQLLGLSTLLKSIHDLAGKYSENALEFVLSAFQQYVRNQCMMTVWDKDYDKLAPQFSKNNFRPKNLPVENSFFPDLGRGNWTSCGEAIVQGREWADSPWELVSTASNETAGDQSKSIKVSTEDPVPNNIDIRCGSSTDLNWIEDGGLDLCITDPPFGDLMQYAEWSDFFYVWLRLLLKDKYPVLFGRGETPRDLEVVSNRARHAKDADDFYRRLLTACWKNVREKLKPAGILAFTFHHSEDGPWIDVLESLFEAGFILEATFPIRGDETKGEGQYGSQKVEYDIIHVCRKRTEETTPVSWGRMRREVLADVRQLQRLLENHAQAGLPAADLQVIRRGKALEYFSRHYGKVYVDEGRPISVTDALIGINQLIDEDANKTNDPPPVTAEPITRQFLSIFQGKTELARDQMQKLLRGSGIAPDEFTNRGWASEQKKVFQLVNPLEFARDWQGRHKRRLTADLDQALVLVGACYDSSGINASDTLKNENFKPHSALKSLLDWLSKRGSSQPMRNAASRALSIYNGWAENNHEAVKQLSLFQEE
jgi:putative DNA methylase